MLKLLQQDVGSSFSDLWYRIGPTRPTLSPHSHTIRQSYGGHISYIVEDPASGQYYRLSESAHFFLGLLDGRRAVDDAWQACNVQLGDDAPTQRECVDLLSRLQLFGLLSGDLPLAADMIELRRREARSRRVQRRTGRGFSMTIPLVNPERALERSKHLLRMVFSAWGMALWVAVVCVALVRVFAERGALASQLNGVLDPSNLFWMGVVFVGLRALHELGHAAACKAMGGRCTEIGLMLIALVLPFPYCDTSSAWRLPEVHKRVIVSAGGVLFETFIAATAAILWAGMGDGDAGLARTLLYNVMVISGVTTIVFNLNPLLRYDGYYILSDLTGAANLAQRSVELWRFLLLRFVFSVRSARPPSVRDQTELWLLLTYGLLSLPYRVLVLVSIVLILWSHPTYLTIGVVLAAVAVCMWILWPLLKGLAFLTTSPRLLGRRTRAILITGSVIVVAFLVLGTVPMPAGAYATGAVEAAVEEPIRPDESGFVEKVHVQAGDTVNAGDPLLTLYNADVVAEFAHAQAVVAGAMAEVDAAAAYSIPDRLLTEARLGQVQGALRRAQERVDALTVRAGVSGRVVPSAGSVTDLSALTGVFLTKGGLVGSVASLDHLVVRCVVADRDHAYVFRGRMGEEVTNVRASVRVRGQAGTVVDARIARVSPAGSRFVSRPSLSTQAGGDVLMDPTDPEGKATVQPHFVVEVEPAETSATWQPGLRARVRFGIEARPMAAQWWRTLRQFLSDRMPV